jgi:hypothetical protein
LFSLSTLTRHAHPAAASSEEPCALPVPSESGERLQGDLVPARPQWKKLAGSLLAAGLVVNGWLLVAGVGFVYLFGQSRDVVERVQHALATGDWRAGPSYDAGTYFLCVAVIVAAIIAVFTLVVAFISLFVGESRFRSLRMWLVFTALVAGWIGLVSGWPNIYWNGQLRRVRPVLAEAESMLRELNADWPTEDGERPGLGPFQAYPMYSPVETPTMLMLLREGRFAGTAIRFSGIARMRNTKVMRIQLSGDDTGSWLEWRDDDSPPESFIGGLDTDFKLERYQRLAPRWYLVRYKGNSDFDAGSLTIFNTLTAAPQN